MKFWPAPAKLNLFLHVVGRRPDGYHDLQTIFQLVDLADAVAKAVNSAPDGALAKPIAGANCAAWSDFSKRGKLDLFVGCLRGPNRYYRNLGGGKFADAGEEIGFYRRIFNTRGLAVVDMNKDGVLDLVRTYVP